MNGSIRTKSDRTRCLDAHRGLRRVRPAVQARQPQPDARTLTVRFHDQRKTQGRSLGGDVGRGIALVYQDIRLRRHADLKEAFLACAFAHGQAARRLALLPVKGTPSRSRGARLDLPVLAGASMQREKTNVESLPGNVFHGTKRAVIAEL